MAFNLLAGNKLAIVLAQRPADVQQALQWHRHKPAMSRQPLRIWQLEHIHEDRRLFEAQRHAQGHFPKGMVLIGHCSSASSAATLCAGCQ